MQSYSLCTHRKNELQFKLNRANLLPIFFSILVVQHSSEEFVRFETIQPILQHGRNKREIGDTRVEVILNSRVFMSII